MKIYDSSRPFGVISNKDANYRSEHFKNSLKHNVPVFVVASGLAYGSIKAASTLKLAKPIVKVFDKGVKLLGKAAKAIGISGTKIGQKLMNLPGRYKIFGSAAALLLGYTLIQQSKYDYERGQIDQKYNDKIAHKNHCTAEDVKEFYANGGKGVQFA